MLLKYLRICAILLGYTYERIDTKMTIKGFIKKALSHACAYFSIIMLGYIIIAAIINVGDKAILLEAGRTVLFFLFSLLWACANVIFSIKTIGGGVRLVVHYLIMLFAFFACLLLPLSSLKASGYLIGAVIFTLIYFAIMGLIHLFTSKLKANVESTENYEKQFSKKPSKKK